MKKFFLLFIICLGFHVIPTNAQIIYNPVTSRNLSDVILDNGIYKLPVEYQSHTGYNTDYVLDVKIQNDNVVCIYFGSGGYLHNGYNNSGYTWQGGGISWKVDRNGNIVRGYAIIHVSYDNGGYQRFTVRIE